MFQSSPMTVEESLFLLARFSLFLTRQGINGYFEMELTPEHKFVSIKKLS